MRLSAAKIAKQFGVPIRQRGPGEPFWDGKQLALRRNLSDFIHDVAHWLVCPTKWKTYDEFGLGPDPSGTVAVRRHRSSDGDEESMTSLLGIAIERRLGRNWRRTAMQHNWSTARDVGPWLRYSTTKGRLRAFTWDEMLDTPEAKKLRRTGFGKWIDHV